jgi:hypothetical protein
MSTALRFSPTVSPRPAFDPRLGALGTLPSGFMPASPSAGYKIGTPLRRAPASSGLSFGTAAPAADPFTGQRLTFGPAVSPLSSFFSGGVFNLGTPVQPRASFDPRLDSLGTLPGGFMTAARSTTIPQVNTVDIDGGTSAIDSLRDLAGGIMGSVMGGGETQTDLIPVGFQDDMQGLLTPMNIAIVSVLALGAYYVATR